MKKVFLLIIRYIEKYCLIILGSAIAAIGLNVFLVPFKIASGGVAGLATVIYYLSNQAISIGILMLIINVPLFIWGMIAVGKKYMVEVFLSTVIFSVVVDLLEPISGKILNATLGNSEVDLLLFSVFGGALIGFGLGIIYRLGTNTGGTDLIGDILRRKNPGLSMGQAMLIFDGIIVVIASIAFKSLFLGMYAIVAILVFSKVADVIIDGFAFKKGVYIITDAYEEIAQEILHRTDRGVTGIKIVGKYTNTDREMIFCVANAKEVSLIKKIVKEIDKSAFLIITEVREVLGEGFLDFDNEIS